MCIDTQIILTLDQFQFTLARPFFSTVVVHIFLLPYPTNQLFQSEGFPQPAMTCFCFIITTCTKWLFELFLHLPYWLSHKCNVHYGSPTAFGVFTRTRCCSLSIEPLKSLFFCAFILEASFLELICFLRMFLNILFHRQNFLTNFFMTDAVFADQRLTSISGSRESTCCNTGQPHLW